MPRGPVFPRGELVHASGDPDFILGALFLCCCLDHLAVVASGACASGSHGTVTLRHSSSAATISRAQCRQKNETVLQFQSVKRGLFASPEALARGTPSGLANVYEPAEVLSWGEGWWTVF